jgi:hypothetical protein
MTSKLLRRMSATLRQNAKNRRGYQSLLSTGMDSFGQLKTSSFQRLIENGYGHLLQEQGLRGRYQRLKSGVAGFFGVRTQYQEISDAISLAEQAHQKRKTVAKELQREKEAFIHDNSYLLETRIRTLERKHTSIGQQVVRRNTSVAAVNFLESLGYVEKQKEYVPQVTSAAVEGPSLWDRVSSYVGNKGRSAFDGLKAMTRVPVFRYAAVAGFIGLVHYSTGDESARADDSLTAVEVQGPVVTDAIEVPVGYTLKITKDTVEVPVDDIPRYGADQVWHVPSDVVVCGDDFLCSSTVRQGIRLFNRGDQTSVLRIGKGVYKVGSGNLAEFLVVDEGTSYGPRISGTASYSGPDKTPGWLKNS